MAKFKPHHRAQAGASGSLRRPRDVASVASLGCARRVHRTLRRAVTGRMPGAGCRSRSERVPSSHAGRKAPQAQGRTARRARGEVAPSGITAEMTRSRRPYRWAQAPQCLRSISGRSAKRTRVIRAPLPEGLQQSGPRNARQESTRHARRPGSDIRLGPAQAAVARRRVRRHRSLTSRLPCAQGAASVLPRRRRPAGGDPHRQAWPNRRRGLRAAMRAASVTVVEPRTRSQNHSAGNSVRSRRCWALPRVRDGST